MTVQRRGPWYHGSPHELTVLRKGSMVTPFEAVAKAFSHKPSILTFSGDVESVKHDGREPGHLHVVSEDVGPDDLHVLPGTGETHCTGRSNVNCGSYGSGRSQ